MLDRNAYEKWYHMARAIDGGYWDAIRQDEYLGEIQPYMDNPEFWNHVERPGSFLALALFRKAPLDFLRQLVEWGCAVNHADFPETEDGRPLPQCWALQTVEQAQVLLDMGWDPMVTDSVEGKQWTVLDFLANRGQDRVKDDLLLFLIREGVPARQVERLAKIRAAAHLPIELILGWTLDWRLDNAH